MSQREENVMRTAIAVFALAVGLALTAAGRGFAASGGVVQFMMLDGSVRSVTHAISDYGFEKGPISVTLEERDGSARGRIRGTVEQGGRAVHRRLWFALLDRTQLPPAFPAAADCLRGWPREWNGGQASIRDRGPRSAELRLQHPRDPRCVLAAELAPIEPSGPTPEP
jgi:hypothetical protein